MDAGDQPQPWQMNPTASANVNHNSIVSLFVSLNELLQQNRPKSAMGESAKALANTTEISSCTTTQEMAKTAFSDLQTWTRP
jgi:hypothetical protein